MDSDNPQRKHPGGRPPWVEPDPKVVENLASRGLTKKEIAASLGICYQTLLNRRKSLSSFSLAIERGELKAIGMVKNALWEMAVSKKCIAATIYFLKIKAGPEWRQDQNYGLEHSGEIEHKIANERRQQLDLVRALTPEQRQAVREHQRQIVQILQNNQQAEIETTATTEEQG